ncbi:MULTISPECIES: efflux RND transporter periplasmic adaptor subunit [unclassified Roseovarius]|uniref:efflux RND transporter periplasmic adaptor subunit n=1 Tax=unclassified Roseovarius TaxID=2614913 RepID=UPI00273D2339|nr:MULTISPECIES: efflux RND transporter periplasmic adaptor subunit [unclassified Roseovarius]
MKNIWKLTAVLILGIASMGQAQDDVPLAKIVKVTSQKDDVARQFFGHVVAKETVDLAFQVGGQLIEIPVVEGEPIEDDGLIAKLDPEPFQLALDQAITQKEQADRTLERLSKLEGNTVSQVSVDDAQTQADLAAIAVRDAERSLRHSELRAPFDALVATRNVANFSTVSAGTPIVRLHDMSELRIEIDVPETLFQEAGRDPDIDLWAKFPASEEQFPLETREFNAETSQVGQTFRITLGMAPPENLVVLPGSSVTVTSVIRGDDRRIIIPASAVVTANDGSTHVMAFGGGDEDVGTVTPVPVEITPTQNGATQVLSGLEEGQEIVASGATRLGEGDRVRRFTGFAN